MNNWNLLCPHLRGIYNNVEAFGSFMESFIVCNAKKKHRPAWYGKFSLLVQLIAKMMDTCTPTTYDAMKWKTNPAEFIHVIRTHEAAPAPITQVRPERTIFAIFCMAPCWTPTAHRPLNL